MQELQTPMAQTLTHSTLVPQMPKYPPHVFQVKNKTGRHYTYHQRKRGTPDAGQRTRLPDYPSPEFWAEYARIEQLPEPKLPDNRVELLAREWMASHEFQRMSQKTQKLWAGLIQIVTDSWGHLPVDTIEPKNVLHLRDLYAETPGKANNLLRCLGSMLSWSVPRGWRHDNPCREVKQIKGGDGYAPWPWEVIEDAQATLRPDLWHIVALALYSGQRLSDVLSMTWTQVERGHISVKQGKTGKALLIPIHRDLAPVLEGIERRAVQILTSPNGTPWTPGRFQITWSRHRPAEVAQRKLVFHGLRKSAVVMLLEAGCTDAEVAAITGQSRAMVEHYAKGVNQERLARSAMDRWECSR